LKLNRKFLLSPVEPSLLIFQSLLAQIFKLDGFDLRLADYLNDLLHDAAVNKNSNHLVTYVKSFTFLATDCICLLETFDQFVLYACETQPLQKFSGTYSVLRALSDV
jgi:hypothetical protein